MFVETCVNCGRLPEIKQIEGMWYVMCNCKVVYAKSIGYYWENRYNFMGLKKDNAIALWNSENGPAKKRLVEKRRKEKKEIAK